MDMDKFFEETDFDEVEERVDEEKKKKAKKEAEESEMLSEGDCDGCKI